MASKMAQYFAASKDDAIAVNQIFDLLEDVFASGEIHDWSTNDWLCVK